MMVPPDSFDAALKRGNWVVWAMRRRQLPVLPPRENMVVAVWPGEHPSPAFYGMTVWFTGYRMPLDMILRERYGGISFDRLVPQGNPLLSLLLPVGNSFAGRTVEIMMPLIRKERK